MRRRILAFASLGTLAIGLACGSFATESANSAGDAGVDGVAPADGGGGSDAVTPLPALDAGCTVLLDEDFTNGLKTLSDESFDGDGGSIGVDGGALVAVVGVLNGEGEAEVQADFPTNGNAEYGLSFVVTDLQPPPAGWENATVGCVAEFDPQGSEARVRARSQNGELKFEVSRGGNQKTRDVGNVPTTKTVVKFAIRMTYVDGKVTGELALDGGPFSTTPVSHDAGGPGRPLRIKCGFDFAQTSQIPTAPYVRTIDDVRLVRCPL